MVLGAQAVKGSKAGAVIFGVGNTGRPSCRGGLFVVGRIKGVERPCLMSMPSLLVKSLICLT